ncbi:MAG: carboxypeptidase regulatory-like domain-containing protein [Bryobacteraceae bacterium]
MPRSRSTPVFWAFLLLARSAWAEVAISGRVLDDRGSPAANVQLWVGSASEHKILASGSTDSAGSFRLTLDGPGSYLLNASKQGFFQIENYPLAVTEASLDVLLTLTSVREAFQSLDVNGTPSPVDLETAGTQERLTGTNINDTPFPATNNLRNALRFMPGAIQDTQGRLHFQGGAEWQTNYLLEGFRVGDPIDGTFTARVGVEGIQSAEFLGGTYSPQYGYGSAGVLEVRTDPGSNVLRYSATNFVPGVDTRYKLHIGDWTPRAAVSGSLIRNRAWFSNNMDGTFSQAYAPGQPAGANFSHQWSASNLLHTQWNLTHANVLFTDFLANVQSLEFAGLAPLTPISATQDQRYRQWLYGLKDQHTFSRGFLVEIGFAQQNVFRRIIPQGDQPYVITPLGVTGNYFVNSTQTARRDQVLTNAYLPVMHWLGTHQIKFGAEAFWTQYNGLFGRTSYQHLGVEGQLLSVTTFAGTGQFALRNVEAGSYFSDQWKPSERVLVSLGVRQDWDELVGRSTWSPRVAISAAPFSWSRTRVSAGFAVTVDASNLQQFSQPLDQLSVMTSYNLNGQPLGLPLAEVYSIPQGLGPSKYSNWTAGVNQQLNHNLFVTARYLAKRGSHSLTYVSAPVSDPAIETYLGETVGMPVTTQAYSLANLRRDRYDSVEITAHQVFGKQYQWMASYVRSRAISTAVFNQSIDQPLNVLNNFGPLPWDSPNRFIHSAFFPLPWKKWDVAYLIDLRSGFPYSIQDAQGNVVGAANSSRFPTNFDLNVHLERRFEFHHRRFALRVGVNNLTNHKNPTAVYNTVGTPQFGQFIGDEGRHVVLRIRFFGKGR